MSGGRAVPHNLDAEREVLGTCVLYPDAFAEVAAVLNNEHFFLPYHREVFDAMLVVARNPTLAINVYTVDEQMRASGVKGPREGHDYALMQLADKGRGPALMDWAIRAILASAKARAMIQLCGSMIDHCFGTAALGTDAEAFAAFEAEVFRINGVRGIERTYEQMVRDQIAVIEARAQDDREIRGVPCGIHDLDVITGGAQAEQLIIVAARPGMGKSALVSNNWVMHAAVSLKIPCIVFSFEMGPGQNIDRHLAFKTGFPGKALKRGGFGNQPFTRDQWRDTLYPASMALQRAPIVIEERTSMSIDQVCATIRRFRRNERFFPKAAEAPAGTHPLGLVVVDYLQLAKGSADSKRSSREQEIAEITRELKSVAMQTKLPVIAVSQLNRGLEKRENKRPMLSDLRESGAIEQDADVVIFIHREEMFLTAEERAERLAQNSELPLQNAAELIVAKNRDGNAGGDRRVMCWWDGPTTTFHATRPDDDSARDAR